MPEYDPFEISAILPDFQAQVDDYRVASERTRATLRSQLDRSYGDRPRQRLDLFFPPGEIRGAPIHLFIHGGYWRAQVKEDYAFVADGITATGAIAAIVEYTLLPGIRMDGLVDEIRAAATWLAAHAADFGGDGAKLSASGHSAGGHLVTYLASRAPHEPASPLPPVRSVMPISGVFDLHPITTSYLQPELHLTPEEVALWSPVRAVPAAAVHYEIVVGAAETQPFHQQARDLSQVLAQHDASAERHSVSGEDHMSVLRKLGVVGSPVQRLLAEMIARSQS